MQEPQKSIDNADTLPMPDPTLSMDSQPVDTQPMSPVQAMQPLLDESMVQEGAEEEMKTHDECLVDICPEHLDDVISIDTDDECVMSPKKQKTPEEGSEVTMDKGHKDGEKQLDPPEHKSMVKGGVDKEAQVKDTMPTGPGEALPVEPPAASQDDNFELEQHLDSEEDEKKGTFKAGKSALSLIIHALVHGSLIYAVYMMHVRSVEFSV